MKNIQKFLKIYFIDAMGAMAQGLFASLLIGMILEKLFSLISFAPLNPIIDLIVEASSAKSPVVGAAIGVAIAVALKVKPLVVYSSAVVGALAYGVSADGISAGPVGAFIAVSIAATIANLVAGKTKLDIILVPSVCLITGAFVASLIGPSIALFMTWLGSLINQATMLQPFFMGVLVSLAMSLILFSPLSSAAMSIMLGLSGLAAGAATAGCAASMVGFAFASYRENKFSGLISQGIGTSMLQIGNAVAKPQILIPASTAAIIVGPLSTLVFKMENNAFGAGMGSSGLVGQITTWATMSGQRDSVNLLVSIVSLHFILPALIAFAVSELMRKKSWIKFGDMQI